LRIDVDGRSVEVADGATVIEAIRAAGIGLAALCFDPRLSPRGSCRTCLVSVDGGEPVAACTTPGHEGARVCTEDPVARAAARGALELILAGLPPRALELDGGRSELVAACELLDADPGRFGSVCGPDGKAQGRALDSVDQSHPYIRYDPELCIACERCVRMCDEVQGTFALTMVGRGGATRLAPDGPGDWLDSSCVSCGGCVDSCPTRALSEPGEEALAEAVVTTTCGYCGVGCSLDVHIHDGAVARVRPSLDGPVNRGHACVKGRFAHGFARATDRLQTPLVRRNGRLVPTTWDEALALVAGAWKRIIAEDGPDAIAAISSARATNEENYLVQKLMRTVLGTNNVDNCARICHAPSASGLTASFGLSGGTESLEELERAQAIMLVGSNPTEAHPVVGARLKQMVLRGAALVVIDPRRTELTALADVHLRPRPGTNVALLHGLAWLLRERGLIDERFLAQRAEGLDELLAIVAEYPPERVSELTGVPRPELERAAAIYGEADGAAIVYGLGVTEHAHGTDGVRALCNLAILTGNVGTPLGGGVNPLRGQNNVQGASDVGALPDLLPGYQPVADPVARAPFETAWGVPVRPERGLRIPEMFSAALAGRLRSLWIVGEDVAQTDPDTVRIESALRACELVICQELFLSATAELADVVLPAASFLEKDGTFTNFDRRVQRVRPAIRPPSVARTDFEIVLGLAAALEANLGCPTPAQAFAELASVAPIFAGMSHERLDREGALHWPCRSPDSAGEAKLYRERFETPSGRAALAAIPYRPPGEEPDEEYPMVLITGRRLEHYNAGTMTRRTDNLRLRPDERAELNPADAARLGVATGDHVRLESARGAIVTPVSVTERVLPGQLFLAFHFPEVAANVLTSDVGDEITDCPEYKVTAVRATRA
jgi:formate dehydrogenase major subunit